MDAKFALQENLNAKPACSTRFALQPSLLAKAPTFYSATSFLLLEISYAAKNQG
jgi:hypothetical protein